MLYALTGYPYDAPEVFELDPDSGTVLAGPLSIASPASADSDGFTVLPSGNFLINQGDASPLYNEYNGTTGALVSGGLAVDLTAFGFGKGTGVATSPDGGSLFFIADFKTLVETDLAGHLLGFQDISFTQIEDIDVVIP